MNIVYWQKKGGFVRTLTRSLIGACCLITLVTTARAHWPVLEDQFVVPQLYGHCPDFPLNAAPIIDPTQTSLAIYGRLAWPNEIDIYTFVPANSKSIPVEALVPAQQSNQNFRPAVIVIGRDIAPSQQSDLPMKLPEGFGAWVIKPPDGERVAFFDKRMLERLYRGNEQWIQLTAGQPYYIALYEPNHVTGSYSLGLGSTDNFQNVSKLSILKNTLAIKMGLFGGKWIPWLDLLGLCLLTVGLTLGMGAVIVTLLSRNSTSLTINPSDITNRLLRVVTRYVWAGIAMAITGSVILYRRSYLSGVATFQAMLAIALVAYVIYLRSRTTKAESGLAVFSLVWFCQLFLFVWYVLMLR